MFETDSQSKRIHPEVDYSLVPQRRSGFYVKKIPCCSLLIDGKDHYVLKLDDASLQVWGLCAKSLTVGEILTRLRESYPERSESVKRDVFRVLDTLREYEAIELLPG